MSMIRKLLNNKPSCRTVLKVCGMIILICVVLGLVIRDVTHGAIITANQYDGDMDLQLAFVVNRHGERTPAEEEAALSKDKDLIMNLTYVEGYEGLTNEGKRRAYQMGKFLRQRYGSEHHLLSKLYLQDEIHVRSTDKERTKMTAQIAMSALYPPELIQRWDGGLGRIWQPVPYTAVPLSEDYLRFYSNCGHFKELLQSAKMESLRNDFVPFMDLIPLLMQETGANFTKDPLLFETLHDLFSSQIRLGLDLPEWAKPIIPRLTEAATLAYRLYFRTEEMKKIAGGVMLNDFLTLAKEIKSGVDVKKRVRVFSSHDFNLGALMAVSKIVDGIKTLPEYGAVFVLELYRSRIDDQYYVLPVYISQAGTTNSEIRKIKGCDSNIFCDLTKFEALTKEYLILDKDFYNLCNIKTEL